ncbi:MAG: ParB/RepB/Spo0J family partition protein [Firmicutes bacterium]|nr:ParB/RepB/Spo0J family partition protein [Bacillota bacterium]
MREYEKNPSLTYEDSIVSKFSEKYKPNNLQEALYGETFDRDCRTAQISFTHGFSVFRVPIVPMPWSSDSNIDFYYSGKWAKTDSGRTHFRRTIETYESIKNHGFNPDEYSDGSLQHGYIRIVILKSGNDCRFVITGGQHRVAALATLGWEEIPVIFEHHFLASPPVVDIKNLDHWPVVRRGIYDKKAAYRVFEAFFTDQSRLKLEKLGLIY